MLRLAIVRLAATERIGDEPVALTVLGNEREAARDAPATSRSRTGPPSMKMRPVAMRTPPHHAFEELASARAHQTVDAEDLAFAHGQRDMIDLVAAGSARQADVLGAERLVADRVVLGLGEILGGGADHLPHDPLHIDIGHPLSPVTRPSRSTVMKSPIRISSSRRCEI